MPAERSLVSRLFRSVFWLVVVILLLSPGLWLAWKYQAAIEKLFRGPEDPHVVVPLSIVDAPNRVGALGRIEPGGGIMKVAGPSRFVVVVRDLLVDRGDFVNAGQLIATLDSIGVEQAEVERLKAQLEQTELELTRTRSLLEDELVSQSELDRVTAERNIVAATLAGAEAELWRSHVRAPATGRVLEIHTRSGEKVGPSGIVEIADTRDMVVIAEVYETDIRSIEVGQQAVVRSPVFPDGVLAGEVRRVGLKVARRDVLNSDPVADVDTRVIEVEIGLESSAEAANLTNLRVKVAIATGS